MSEEEKEAINCLKGLCTDDCINHDIVDKVLNLIDKQQKEIEHLQEKYNHIINFSNELLEEGGD